MMGITPDQQRVLEEMMGEDGYLITTVTQAIEINRATKILYLQRALHQPCEDFNISLDALNRLYNPESTERLEVIRCLKTINDLYHNNEIRYEVDGPVRNDLPSFLTRYETVRKALNHSFGFEFNAETRYDDTTDNILKQAFQPLIYRKVQAEINDLYLGLRSKILLQRQQLRLEDTTIIKTNPRWRLELSLPDNQLLESQQSQKTCICGGLFFGRDPNRTSSPAFEANGEENNQRRNYSL